MTAEEYRIAKNQMAEEWDRLPNGPEKDKMFKRILDFGIENHEARIQSLADDMKIISFLIGK